MTLACRANGEHLTALLRDWLDYGLALDVDDSGDAEEYAAALDGMRLPPKVEAWARPGSPGKWSSENAEAEGTANRPRPAPAPAPLSNPNWMKLRPAVRKSTGRAICGMPHADATNAARVCYGKAPTTRPPIPAPTEPTDKKMPVVL